MSIERLPVKNFLQHSKNNLILDVRSPGEYNHAHIPSAINFPLFTDEERKIVGTTYKQKSREEAIKMGLDFFGQKMRRMVEEAEKIADSRLQIADSGYQSQISNLKSQIFIYCWRGGMRSAGIAWLLDLYGFKVYTLAGGYKSFRNYVLQTFEQAFEIKILGGYTGSGKTEVLNELEKIGTHVIDLEKIACHKGSAFGSFNMPQQPTQEMFENLLSCKLKTIHSKQENLDLSSSLRGTEDIWLEDESQRIGNLNIPSALWKKMRNAPIIFLEIPFEERIDQIIKEYGSCDKEKLIEAIQRISKRLGGLDTKNTIEFLESGNIREAFRILLLYYDKHYSKSLHNRESLPALLTKISCETVTPKNAYLLTKHETA